jgi:hypothetical protein
MRVRYDHCGRRRLDAAGLGVRAVTGRLAQAAGSDQVDPVTDVVCRYCQARYETVLSPELVGVIRRCAFCQRRGLWVDDGSSTLLELDMGLVSEEDPLEGDERRPG